MHDCSTINQTNLPVISSNNERCHHRAKVKRLRITFANSLQHYILSVVFDDKYINHITNPMWISKKEYWARCWLFQLSQNTSRIKLSILILILTVVRVRTFYFYSLATLKFLGFFRNCIKFWTFLGICLKWYTWLC